MDGSLIDQGLELMLFGMGTVIVFLTMLVFATGTMSNLVLRFSPPEEDHAPTAAAATTSGSGPDATTFAVIAAAIHKHRSRR